MIQLLKKLRDEFKYNRTTGLCISAGNLVDKGVIDMTEFNLIYDFIHKNAPKTNLYSFIGPTPERVTKIDKTKMSQYFRWKPFQVGVRLAWIDKQIKRLEKNEDKNYTNI